MASATAPLPTTGGALDAKVTVHPTPARDELGNHLRGCRFSHDFGVDAVPLDEMVEGGPHGGRAQWCHEALSAEIADRHRRASAESMAVGHEHDARVTEDGRGIEIVGHLHSPGEAEIGASVPNQVHDGIGGRGREHTHDDVGAKSRELTDEVGECHCEPEDRHDGHLSGHHPSHRVDASSSCLGLVERGERAASTKTTPASVVVIPRGRRWNKSTPSSASRARSVWDTAELDWCNAAAARVTLPSSATATTTANPRRSTDQGR